MKIAAKIQKNYLFVLRWIYTNLKYLEVKNNDSIFYKPLSNINLENCNNLEILNLDLNYPTKYLKKKYFKTLLSIKTLKEIKFAIKDINKLIKIKGENTSVTKLHILLENSINNCLYEFHTNFLIQKIS